MLEDNSITLAKSYNVSVGQGNMPNGDTRPDTQKAYYFSILLAPLFGAGSTRSPGRVWNCQLEILIPCNFNAPALLIDKAPSHPLSPPTFTVSFQGHYTHAADEESEAGRS